MSDEKQNTEPLPPSDGEEVLTGLEEETKEEGSEEKPDEG